MEQIIAKDAVNILVTIDNKYLHPLITMLNSYEQNHVGIKTNVFIAHSALTEEEIQMVQNAVKKEIIHIHSIQIKDKWFAETPVLERLPEESFYRLMAFHYLPKEVSKCLYLDPDIYIKKSLLPLYETDIDGYYIAAASHLRGFHNKINCVRLGLEEQERYINSGVMLMNLDYMRETLTIPQILECLNDNVHKLLLGDQDLINILFDGKIKMLDEFVYNLDESTRKHNKKKVTESFVENETAIIHYNGKYKPWLQGYKGTLNQYYPEQEEKGPAPKGKWHAQIKAIRDIICASHKVKAAIASVTILLVLFISLYIRFGESILHIVSEPDRFKAWIEQFGIWDEVIFILIRSAQTVVKFIPAEPLEIASGYVWGAVGGTFYCLVGNIIGTIVILFLTKKYGKKLVDYFVPVKNQKIIYYFKDSKKIYWIILLLYLIPGSPKDGITYMAGLLQIKTIPFLLITAIARIPSIASSAICGELAAMQEYKLSIGVFLIIVLFSALSFYLYHRWSKKQKEKR